MAHLFASLGNHLWQSTLLALGIVGLALLLRYVPARTRCWLWMAASVKFVLPLAVLFSLGSRLAPVLSSRGSSELEPAPYYSVNVISQPFTYTSSLAPSPHRAVAAKGIDWRSFLPLPVELLIVWALGVITRLLSWFAEWRKVSRVLAKATPMTAGPELEALRRLELREGLSQPVKLVLSKKLSEPGIFGIVQPVLVWPSGISERLSAEQMELVLAHELAHVRRHDNLIAAVQAMLTALFWFHPLMWWLQARLLAERERACDEAVIADGGEPEVYAAGILRICEFSLGALPMCVAGISGAGLSSRVRRIMTSAPERELTRAARWLLGSLVAVAMVGPVVFGVIDAPRVSAALLRETDPAAAFHFASISIRPTPSGGENRRLMKMTSGQLSVQGMPLLELIMSAYNARAASEITGYPEWVGTARYDIEATADDATLARLKQMPHEQSTREADLMLQALLAERFHLQAVRETQQLPVYALVVAGKGEALKPAAATGPPSSTSLKTHLFTFHTTSGDLEGTGAILDQLVFTLAGMPEAEGRPVVDRTGLKGTYDFTLHWTPAGSSGTQKVRGAAPGLFTALQEQLGLKLEPQKGLVETLVVKRVERPSTD